MRNHLKTLRNVYIKITLPNHHTQSNLDTAVYEVEEVGVQHIDALDEVPRLSDYAVYFYTFVLNFRAAATNCG